MARHTELFHAVAAFVLLTAVCVRAGTTIYVDAANQGGTEDGTSWATAWGTIAEGRSDLTVKNGASPGGHTVLVKGGAYYEEVNLNAGHSGTGEAGRNTIKTEESAYVQGLAGQYGFEINSADYITIDGFRVYARYMLGMYINGADYLVVRNCEVHSYVGGQYGLQFSAAISPIVENCTIWSCAEGMFCYVASGMITVRSSIIAGCGVGIHERGDGFTLSNCVFYANGIHWYEKVGGYRFTEESLNESPDGTNLVVANPGFYLAGGYIFNRFYTNTVCATAAGDGGFVGAYQASQVTYFETSDCTYYVDNATGDDAYTTGQAQNPATPWKTIGKASGNAVAGDTVIVKAGTYDLGASSLTITRGGTYDALAGTNLPVTYLAEPRGSVTIQSTANQIVMIQRTADVVFDGFNINNLGAQPTYDYGIRLENSAGCTLRNIAVSNMNGTSGYGIQVYGGGGHVLSNVELAHNNAYGLYMTAGGCTVMESSFHDNKYGISKRYPTTLFVERSRIYNNTSYGVRSANGYSYTGANYTQYQNCMVYGNGSGIDVEKIAVAYDSRGAAIYNCVVYSNVNFGVRNISNGARSYIYNTIVADNPRYGVYEGDAASEAYIRCSCVWNNATNFYDEGTTVLSTEAEINAAGGCYSNVVADPVFFNGAIPDFRIDGNSPCVDSGQDLSSSGVTNDFFGNRRPRLNAYDIGIFESPPEGMVVTFW